MENDCARRNRQGENKVVNNLRKNVRVGVEEFDSMGVGGLGFEVFGIQWPRVLTPRYQGIALA